MRCGTQRALPRGSGRVQAVPHTEEHQIRPSTRGGSERCPSCPLCPCPTGPASDPCRRDGERYLLQDQSWTFWKERGRELFPEQGVGCDWAAPGQRAGERAHPDQCCPGRRRQRLYPEAGAAAGGLWGGGLVVGVRCWSAKPWVWRRCLPRPWKPTSFLWLIERNKIRIPIFFFFFRIQFQMWNDWSERWDRFYIS